jgi:protease IV
MGTAHADDSRAFAPRADRMTPYGRSVAADDSSEALVQNPANIGLRGSYELRYSGMRCEDTTRAACGHAVSFTTPIYAGISTGLRVDHLLPGSTALPSAYLGGGGYTWLTWGLSYRLNDRLALGATLQTSFASNQPFRNLFGMTVGATYTPLRYVAMAAVLNDFNSPGSGNFPGAVTPILGRSYTGALALRPTGKRDVEVGIEARVFDNGQAEFDVRPRATLGIDVPTVGRVRADLEVGNVDGDRKLGYVASAGIELALDRYTLGGGAMFGQGLGGGNAWGQFVTASVSGAKEPGLPTGAHATAIRIEDTPGPRTHAKLLRTMWKLAKDNSVKLVVLIPRTEIASSFAHAEELADAIRVLHASGKKTLCSLEDAGAKTLYVCANATKTVITPAGGVRYAGLKSERYYLKGLLDKIGVKAEFVRIGAHKSAPEQFMNSGPSATAKADQEDFLRQQEAVFVRNLAQGRRIDEAAVRASTLKGPFIAAEARDARFVDGYAFDDEVEKVAQDMMGSRLPLVQYTPASMAPSTLGPQPKLGMLYVDGDIVDGRSQTIPILGNRMVGSYTIQESIKALRDDPDVKAVVLRIESPGGSSLASDVMWRELKKLNERKPLIVSMGSVAASGGYYIAVAGREIYALPLTVTGSIGIFYGKADISDMLGKLGITTHTSTTTPRADAESLFRGFTAEERVELDRKVGQFYDMFLTRVADGRHLTKDQVDAVGQGRVWAGQQALRNGLVDKMGGLRHAIEAARLASGLDADAPIIEYPETKTSLLNRAIELAGLRATEPLSVLPVQFQTVARAVAPLAIFPQDTAMARLEWVSLDEAAGIDEQP